MSTRNNRIAELALRIRGGDMLEPNTEKRGDPPIIPDHAERHALSLSTSRRDFAAAIDSLMSERMRLRNA